MSSRPRDVYSFKNNNSNNYLVDICCVRGIAYCDRHRTCAKGQRVERTWPAQGTGSSLFCLDGPPAWRVVWWETSQVVFPEKRTQRWRLASRLLLWERPQGQHLWRKGGGGSGTVPRQKLSCDAVPTGAAPQEALDLGWPETEKSV